MKPLINLISRVLLALALCLSAPVAIASDDVIDRERIAQEIRKQAMSGDLEGAASAASIDNISQQVLRKEVTQIRDHLERDIFVNYAVEDIMVEAFLKSLARIEDKERSEVISKNIRDTVAKAQRNGETQAEAMCKYLGYEWIPVPDPYAFCVIRDWLHDDEVVTRHIPKADYTGLYANAGFVIASAFAPSWVDAQTFAFNEGNNFITGQSLSVPLDDFTFAATRVQVNDLTDYEFAVKWEMEF